jgi:hypothetical protein
MSRRDIGSAIRPVTAVHLQKKGCHALGCGLAAEQQHVIFGMTQMIGGQRPQPVRHPDLGFGRDFKMMAVRRAQLGVDDGFGGQAVLVAGIQAEHVAGEVEGVDLAAAVGQQLVGPHRPGDHLVDMVGGLAFAIDFLVLVVGERGARETGVAEDRIEAVEARGHGRGGDSSEGASSGFNGHFGEHGSSPVRRWTLVSERRGRRYFARSLRGRALRDSPEVTGRFVQDGRAALLVCIACRMWAIRLSSRCGLRST